MINDELKRIYSGSNVNRALDTLEFWHPTWPAAQYIVNDVLDWQFILENGVPVTFRALPFGLKLPDHNAAGAEDLQIVLCNIGRELMSLIEAASGSPETSISCAYRVYLDRPNTAPQINPPLRLQINQITANATDVTATATRFDVLNRPFPTVLYTLQNFPGLRR